MMLHAIECAGPWAAVQPAALSDQRGSFAYHTDLESARFMRFICPLIPASAAAAGDQRLTASTVPALNGAAGLNGQPRNWAGAQALSPGSRDITLAGQGHDVNSGSWVACADPRTQTFIGQAGVANLDTSCLATVPAPPLELTIGGLAGSG